MSIEESISEIKKEIIESHNLIIKTDNLVKNLAAEIRQIQKKQERYERKYIFNSVVSYVIFVVVIFASLYVAFDAKVGVVRREKESLEQLVQRLQGEAKALQDKISLRAQQEKITERFLLLKQQGRPYLALKEAESLNTSALSPVMTRLVNKELVELKQALASRAIESGRSLLQKGQLKRSLREFDRALELSPPAAVLAQVQHHRGLVLSKLKKNAQAAQAFLQAAQADPRSASADNDLFMAAGSFEAAGDVPQALVAYRQLLELHADSPYAAAARRRIQRLSRSRGEASSVSPQQAQPAPDQSPAPAPAPSAKPRQQSPSAAPDQAKSQAKPDNPSTNPGN